MIKPTNKPQAIFDAPKGTYRLEYASNVDGWEDWAAVYPTNSRTWIVNIHSYGRHANELFTHYDQRNIWLEAMTHKGLSLLCPNVRDSSWMSPAAASDLKGLIEYIRHQHSADKFIFFSGDMGATCNLIYAVLHPEDVAGCVCLAGPGDLTEYYNWCRQQSQHRPYEIANAIAVAYSGSPYTRGAEYHRHNPAQNTDKLTMPVIIVQGEKDAIMPAYINRQLAEKIHGDHFEYRELPDEDHAGPFACIDTLDWILTRI